MSWVMIVSFLSTSVFANPCSNAFGGSAGALLPAPPEAFTVIERTEKLFRSYPASARDLLKRSRNPAHALHSNSIVDGFSYGLTNGRGEMRVDVAEIVRGAMLSDGVRMVTAPGFADELRAYYLRVDLLIEYIVRVYRAEFIILRESLGAVHPAADRISFDGAVVIKVRDDVPVSLVTPLGELDVITTHPGTTGNAARALARLSRELGLTHVLIQNHGPIVEEVMSVARDLDGRTLKSVDWYAEKWTFGAVAALELWARVKPSHRHAS